MPMACRVVAVVLALLFATDAAAEQQGGDEQRRFLEVRRRQIELSAARADMQRVQELFEQGLVARTDLDRARAGLEHAQLGYQESLLSLLAQQPRLSVREAVKHQSSDGRRFVRLRVENLTPRFDDSQFRLLSNFDGADPIPEALRTRDVHDVFVSLKSSGEAGIGGQAVARGTTIGLPYEIHLASLKYGESQTLDFQLLRDANSVMVVSTYKGQTQEIDIQLQQAETDELVTLTSFQTSQEADLASQATFDLRLERSTVDVRRFGLKALNLPRQVGHSFVDPASQARLSQLTFPAGVGTQTIGLRLFMPERADEEVRVDEPLEFWALLTDEREHERFAEDRRYARREIEESRAGKIRLFVTPRGVGRIEVSAASLFSEIRPGGRVETSFVVRNTGTRRLDNIRLSADYPRDWRVELTPDVVPALETNREASVTLLALPPAGVPVGDYEIRLRTESYSYNRRVPSEDKVYRVSVKAAANVWGTGMLIILLVGLVAGMLGFGMKLTKR
jgi:hypothetical protein